MHRRIFIIALCLFSVAYPAFSQTPAKELNSIPKGTGILLLAHGGSAKWNDEVLKVASQIKKEAPDMKALADLMGPKTQYKRIEYLTVRDDAPEPIRGNAAAELRTRVEVATGAGNRVLIVPLLLSFDGIEEGVKKRLEGLEYTIVQQGLLPDDRLAVWVKNSVLKSVH